MNYIFSKQTTRMQTINITAHPENDAQIEAIKTALKGLKIKFEIVDEQRYDPEFVKKIEQSKQESRRGKSTRERKEDFESFLGL